MRSSWRTWPRVAAGLVMSLGCATALPADAASTPHRAPGTPMRYFVSLPGGWSASRSWPVLVVVPDAARGFDANLERFVAVRGSRPFILVAPEVLTCGGARTRTPEHYSFTAAEWESLRSGDDFAYDDAGLGAVLADVARRWHGEAGAFLTGWEAGGHTVWAQALRRPERWRGVAPVSTNCQRRGVDATTISRSPARAKLPIQVFFSGATTGDAASLMPILQRQTAAAMEEARAHGFAPAPGRVIPNANHGPLPQFVLAWCDSLRAL